MLEQKQQTDACGLILWRSWREEAHALAARILPFLSPESVFHGWPSTSPRFPTPPRIVLSPKNSPIRSASTALWPQVREWSESVVIIFSFRPFARDVVRTIIFYCLILTFFWYEIRLGFFINIQHVSVYEGFGPGLPRSWAKGVSFFACFPVLCTFFIAWHLYIIETHCETIGWLKCWWQIANWL